MQEFGLLQDSNALNSIHQKSNTLDEPIIGFGCCLYKHLDSFFLCLTENIYIRVLILKVQLD
jgi:hypothetical protein